MYSNLSVYSFIWISTVRMYRAILCLVIQYVQVYTLSGDTVVCCFSFEVKACGDGRERGREGMKG